MDPERKKEIDIERRDRPEDVGRKGGAASMAHGMPYAAETARALAVSPWTVRWGPVWAGFIVAFGIQLVLSALGVAIALSSYDMTNAAAASSAGSFLSIWLGISLLVALFFGGWIAGRGGALLGMRIGWFQGTIVWALAVVTSLLLGSALTSGLLGSVSNMVPALARNIQTTGVGGAAVSPAVARAAVSTAATAAWVFFFASLLQWGAAALGGALAANRVAEHVEER